MTKPPLPPSLDIGPLEDRILYSGTPLVLDGVEVEGNEDGPDHSLDLHAFFHLDDGGDDVQFSVVANSLPGLFAGISVDDADHLVLDFADDAHGVAELTIRGVNAAGDVELLPVHVDLAPINDAPTVGDLNLYTHVDLANGRTTIDLFGAFDDLEDADSDLQFEVHHNSRPDLFSSITIDMEQGLLILQHAPGKSGSAELTIVATDTGELTAGMGTDPNFKVYDVIHELGGANNLPSTEIGLSNLSLWTHWYFFEYASGKYDYSELDTAKFLNILENFSPDSDDMPIVFDIENNVYVNTPEGRDRLAEVFHLAQETRPDLDFGLYLLMPERSWYHPVNWDRAQEHQEMGITSWYTANADKFEQNYLDWLARNELYRTENTSAEWGGQPLADMVDTIQASLYTFMQDAAADPIWRFADVDANNNTFTVDGPSFETVDVVQLKISNGGTLTNGLAQWTNYHVVNAQGNTFQLALTPNGTPIDFTDSFTGQIAVGATGPTWENMWHDPNVVAWRTYAEQNISEARKFDKPVYAWVSPSIQGVGSQYLDPDFFRLQLEILRPLVDGIAIYEPGTHTADFHQEQGWWTALDDFMLTMDNPAATVSISIPANSTQPPAPEPPAPEPPAPEPEPPQVELPDPVAIVDVLTAHEDQPLAFTTSTLMANDQHATGSHVSFQWVNGPDHGYLQYLGNGSWRYIPNDNYHGSDNMSYRLYDGETYSDAAQIVVNVLPETDLPIARDDTVQVIEDQPLRIHVSDLLANDTRGDGTRVNFALGDEPEHGTLSRQADGTLVYRPFANFSGVDHFTYWVYDGNARSAAPATVTVQVVAQNDRPVAVADRLQAHEDQPLQFSKASLLANDIDQEGSPLHFQVVQGPSHGVLIDLGNGQFRYVAHANYHGDDQFIYRVNDGSLDSLATVVAIDVEAVNDAPVAVDDHFTVDEDRSLTLSVDELLANDLDVDGDQLTVELIDQPSHGTFARGAGGAIVYKPAANFSGEDRFGYRISDGNLTSEIVAVYVTVSPVNDAPTVRDEFYGVRAGGTLSVGNRGVLANDSDAEGNALRAQLLRGPTSGTLNLASDGSFVYRPANGFQGNDSFRYRVIDQDGGVSLGTAVIRVQDAKTSGVVSKTTGSTPTPFVVLNTTTVLDFGKPSRVPTAGSDDEKEIGIAKLLSAFV